MRFTKMEGAGNDYIYVDGRTDRPEDPAGAARLVSDRHFGVGSDGLIIINPSDIADFEMEMYNADGSRGRMCGNGIRCVGKYVYDHGLTDKKTLKIETLSGVKTLVLTTGSDGTVSSVRVDMGEPLLKPDEIPVLIPGDRVVGIEREFGGVSYAITCVSMGNPHCVVFTGTDVRELDLKAIGPLFETDPVFPDRVNTEFVNVLDSGHLRMRVWERGSGETMACGTGACAVAAAAFLNGYTGRSVTVSLTGGDLEIEWSEEDGKIYMNGPAREVFKGEINVQD